MVMFPLGGRVRPEPLSQRNPEIDLVKTAAIWNVVLCHVAAAPFSGGTVGTASWYAALLWASLSHACVPLFFMASGALLLRPKKELTLEKLYTRNFLRIATALFFWAFCYKLVSLKLMDSLTLPDVMDAVKHLLLFHHDEHFYYLHITFLAYAALPVTRLIARYADKRLLEYTLALWFLLGILYPTVRSFGLTLLAGFLLAFCGTCGLSCKAGRSEEHFLEGMGVAMFLVALGIWGLCQAVSLSQKGGLLVCFMSRASFCIYLTHIFVLQAFARWGLRAIDGPVLLTAPLISGLMICCCCVGYAVLSRVPFVRRWLV